MLKYIKFHMIQTKVIDLIFKIIWESFFLYAELKKELTKVFRHSLNHFMWNGNSFLSNCLFQLLVSIARRINVLILFRSSFISVQYLTFCWSILQYMLLHFHAHCSAGFSDPFVKFLYQYNFVWMHVEFCEENYL